MCHVVNGKAEQSLHLKGKQIEIALIENKCFNTRSVYVYILHEKCIETALGNRNGNIIYRTHLHNENFVVCVSMSRESFSQTMSLITSFFSRSIHFHGNIFFEKPFIFVRFFLLFVLHFFRRFFHSILPFLFAVFE